MHSDHNSSIIDREEKHSLIKLLADRLERLSADSAYAHKASGLRGNLLRYQERLQSGQPLTPADIEHLEQVIDAGFMILTAAGREIPAEELY
jgi:hypothetical protein